LSEKKVAGEVHYDGQGEAEYMPLRPAMALAPDEQDGAEQAQQSGGFNGIERSW
jgi:hypothetical protein